MFLIVISFVIFNASDMSQAFADIAGMFGAGALPFYSDEWLYYLRSFAVVIVIAIIGSTELPVKAMAALKKNSKIEKCINVVEPVALVVLLVLITAYLVDGSFNPFLYFRF